MGGVVVPPCFSPQIFKQKNKPKRRSAKTAERLFKTVVAPHCQADVSLTTTLAAVGLGKAKVAFQYIRLFG
jgi:hypothetical protein